jgi:hypothetical protein
MESLARAFDQPLDTPEHRELMEHGWVGGDFITVRYWLGRLLRRNFFRDSDDAVKAALKQYFVDQGCTQGAMLAFDFQTWSTLAILLRHNAEVACGHAPTKNPRLVAALEAVMKDPECDDSQLAARANTTEKQIARMTDVHLLRKAWKHRRPGSA